MNTTLVRDEALAVPSMTNALDIKSVCCQLHERGNLSATRLICQILINRMLSRLAFFSSSSAASFSAWSI
jgi:hypothetical protein